MLPSHSGFHPAHWPRRAVVAAALVLAAPAIGSPSARAAGSVRVVPVGGAGAPTVDLAPLKPDVHALSYTTVATPGGTPKTVTVATGYSLPSVLEALHIPANSFGSVEIAAPEGPPVVLNSAEATNRSAYHRGPAVVWEDRAGAHFLVPSSPTGVANAGETFTGPGGAITIALHRGAPLNLGISGSPLRAVVGRPVGFTSKVFGAGTPLHYQWTFGDGTGGSQAAPSHAYTATGTFSVYLQVTGSQDSVGASSVISIVVGDPLPKTSGQGGGTGTSGSTSTTGAGTSGSGIQRGTGTATTPAPKRNLPKPPTPVGTLVSGVPISYLQPATSAPRAGAGATPAAHNGQPTAAGGGPGEGLWIALGALVMLLGGALLEWNGTPRARLATSRPR